jgi:hypothetical protein
MKKLLTIIGFFLISININAQSEEETIQFLNSKLALYTSPMLNGQAYLSVRTGDDYGKVILMDLFVDNELFNTIKFHCSQIDGIITFRSEKGRLCLQILSNKGLIVSKFEGYNETFVKERKIPLSAPDDEVLRIKKAFEHLFNLNGLKSVNDNLFKN